jgi:hypothetical protein
VYIWYNLKLIIVKKGNKNSQRMTFETFLRCQKILSKLNFRRHNGGEISSKEQNFLNKMIPLMNQIAW